MFLDSKIVSDAGNELKEPESAIRPNPTAKLAGSWRMDGISAYRLKLSIIK
jgi:hypothetical protein